MKRIYIYMIFTLFSGNLYAATMNDVSSLNASWGDASDLTCKAHGIGELHYDLCLHKENGCKEKKLKNGNSDEYSNYMWVATKVTEGGAYFCPMRIDARHSIFGGGHTTYHQMSVTDDYCVWLCKDGYGGADCSDNDGDFVCDSSHIIWNCYDKYAKEEARGVNTNSEGSVAMFSRSQRKLCGGSKLEEHDRILTVVEWLGDAEDSSFVWTDTEGKPHDAIIRRGATVRQMMVRANKILGKSWPKIYPAQNSTEILLCKTGYKPDPVSKKCVEINATRCAEQNLCNKYKTGFDETIHTLEMTGEACYKYRCKEEGKAFVSDIDRACVDCPITLRSGPNSADGTCLKCEQDKIYTVSGCKAATRYSKTDLMYGRSKTRSDVPSVKSQCWTVLDTNAYELCVKHGSDSNIYKGYINGTVVSADKAEAPSSTATLDQESALR